MSIINFNKRNNDNAKILYWIKHYNETRQAAIFVYPTRERVDKDETINLFTNTDFPLWEQEFIL